MAGSATSEDGDLGFQIAPMVDVVFVLMLFFMAMAGAQVKEKELGVKLPSGVPPPDGRLLDTIVLVDISESGQVSVNNQPLATPEDRSLQRFRESVKGAIEQFGAEDTYLVRPQPSSKHERIVEVLNALSAAGVKKLTFN